MYPREDQKDYSKCIFALILSQPWEKGDMPPKQCWKKVLNAKSAKVVNDILMTLIGINFKGFDYLMQIICFDSAQLSTG